jgi:hypothetical protein
MLIPTASRALSSACAKRMRKYITTKKRGPSGGHRID